MESIGWSSAAARLDRISAVRGIAISIAENCQGVRRGAFSQSRCWPSFPPDCPPEVIYRICKMTGVVSLPAHAGCDEVIARLIGAGYLRPDQRYNRDAITNAIVRMKFDLRTGRGGDVQPRHDSSATDAFNAAGAVAAWLGDMCLSASSNLMVYRVLAKHGLRFLTRNLRR
jgi:hypothetical protein